MNNDADFENIAERIVRWAADHPLSADEVERKYARLLAGLSPLPAPEWSVFRLGRWAVRYCKGKAEELQESFGAAALPVGVGVRGPPAVSAPAETVERILRSNGPGAVACAKITAGADRPGIDLALWLEPKSGGPSSPFTLTVLGAGNVKLAGPLSCAPDSVVRFSAIEPGTDYTVIFERGADRWEIRWGFADSAGTAGSGA